MKICSQCQKTYSDDNLNFCLDDGSVLTNAVSQPLEQTVIMNQSPVTQQNQPMPSQPVSQAGWSAPQQFSMQQQPKSSKTWIWVVAILAVVVVACGGGLFGALLYVGNKAEKVANNINVSFNRSPSPSPFSSVKNSPSPSPTVGYNTSSLKTGSYYGTAKNTTYNQTGAIMLRIDSVDSGGNVHAYFEATSGLVGKSTMTGTVTDSGKLDLHGNMEGGKQFAVSATVAGNKISGGYGIAGGGQKSESGTFTVTR